MNMLGAPKYTVNNLYLTFLFDFDYAETIKLMFDFVCVG
jgi:hypothetical protein